jgi:hypothetical protein
MKRYRLSQPHAHCLVLSRDTGSGRFFGVLLLVLAGLFCLIWGGDWLAAIETVQLPGPLAVAMLGMALAFGLLGVQLVAGRGFRADATAFLLDNQRAVLEVQHTHRGHTDSHAIPYAQIAAFVVRRTRRRSQNSQNTTRKVYYVYATAVVLQDGSVLDLNNFGTRPEPAARLAEQLTQHQQAAGPVATHAARATAHTPPAGVQLRTSLAPRAALAQQPAASTGLHGAPAAGSGSHRGGHRVASGANRPTRRQHLALCGHRLLHRVYVHLGVHP